MYYGIHIALLYSTILYTIHHCLQYSMQYTCTMYTHCTTVQYNAMYNTSLFAAVYSTSIQYTCTILWYIDCTTVQHYIIYNTSLFAVQYTVHMCYGIYIVLYNTILCTIHHCLQYTTLHYSIHLIDSPLLLLLSTHPVKKDPLHQETIPYQQPLDKLKRRPGEEYRVDLFITNSNKRVRVCNQ